MLLIAERLAARRVVGGIVSHLRFRTIKQAWGLRTELTACNGQYRPNETSNK